LASNTKNREGKITTSLRSLFNLVIIVIFIIATDTAVPSPRVFHSRRRKRKAYYGLRGLKTHGSVHLALAFL
jgi:hypothetical protein